MSNMRVKNLLILFTLLVLAACSDKEEPLEELFLELDASSENVDYGDSFTLTWNSNASQCYAAGRWSGEKPVQGTEEFTIKRGGINSFVLDCRRNNEFINQAVAITIIKSTADYFIFDERGEEPDFTIEYSESEKIVFTSQARGDINDDSIPDIIFGVQTRSTADDSIVQTKLLQMLGGPLPIITEIVTDECDAISVLIPRDLDQDGFTDVVGLSSDHERQNLNTSKLCFFKGTETGLVLDNEFVTNETSLDLSNTGLRIAGLVDRNNNVALDIYLLGESKEYWIEVGATDGPKIEEFDFDNTALDGLTITDVTAFDFDSNSNDDIVFSVYDNEGNGKFVTVPKSGDGTNWAEVLTYDNIPLIKAIENIVYDQDEDIDIFVMGDTNPTNGIDLSPTSTLKVYETGEVNILENELDITFINQATAALNDQIVLADFDQDFDGGDILLSYEDYGDNTASFLIIEKQETTDDEEVTTYSYLAQNNQELGLLNVPDQHAFTILVDYNSDFDIDAIFGIKGELNTETNLKPLNFYIQTNQSN